MSNTITGTSIRDEIKIRLDLPEFTANTIPTLTDVNQMVIDAGVNLAGLIAASDFCDDYLLTSVTLTITGSVYDLELLSPNMNRLRRLAWFKSDTDVVPLRKVGIDDIDSFGTGSQSWGSVDPGYRLESNYLVFYPPPSSAVTLRMHYTKGLKFSTDLTGYIVVWPGWKEWMVQDVMFRIRTQLKEHELAAQSLAMRDAAWQTIIRHNSNRDEWQPTQVRELRDGGARDRYGRPRGWRIP
jgi:hypothetical protein